MPLAALRCRQDMFISPEKTVTLSAYAVIVYYAQSRARRVSGPAKTQTRSDLPRVLCTVTCIPRGDRSGRVSQLPSREAFGARIVTYDQMIACALHRTCCLV